MIPQGKGIFLWQLSQCGNGDPIKIAAMAQQAGFTWVCIKVADGTNNYNQGDPPSWGGPDLLGQTIEALRNVNILIYGWQYIYGANRSGSSIAAKEAKAAIENIDRFDLSGFLIDAETPYKRKGSGSWANTYMYTLRSSYPNISLGLCSYRFPKYHPEFPWMDFLLQCDFHAPQVYWIKAHNAGDQLRASVSQLTTLRSLPVAPVGASYYDPTFRWQPTIEELNDFNSTALELQCPGVSWWEWGENGHGAEYIPEFWDAISKHNWTDPPPPPPPLDWAHALTAWARKLGYFGPDPETIN